MKICCISDTHSYHRQINIPKNVDCLIHAGDISWKGELTIISDFAEWMSALPIKYKIVIMGNHELGTERNEKHDQIVELFKQAKIDFLDESAVEIEGKIFFGSPWTPWFFSWAYNAERGHEINSHWAKIPNNTNVLITHGPAYDILDQVTNGDKVGCQDLLNRIQQLPQLQAHIFGHIHHSYGYQKNNNVQYVNSSVCTENYQPINDPQIIEID